MDDLIDREQAKDAIDKYLVGRNLVTDGTFMARLINEIVIDRLPSAQPEVKQISYTDCANAMLMMWMDKVLTDGEYNRIMDKLNEHEKKKGEDNERLNQQTAGD